MPALNPRVQRDEFRPFLGKRSEEHTSELQSQSNLVCRLLLEKKKMPDKRKPEKSYKRECQEKYLPFGSVPRLFVAAFSPTSFDVHSRFESGRAQAESHISIRR